MRNSPAIVAVAMLLFASGCSDNRPPRRSKETARPTTSHGAGPLMREVAGFRPGAPLVSSWRSKNGWTILVQVPCDVTPEHYIQAVELIDTSGRTIKKATLPAPDAPTSGPVVTRFSLTDPPRRFSVRALGNEDESWERPWSLDD